MKSTQTFSTILLLISNSKDEHYLEIKSVVVNFEKTNLNEVVIVGSNSKRERERERKKKRCTEKLPNLEHSALSGTL